MYLHICKKVNAIIQPRPHNPSPPKQGHHVLNTVAKSNDSGMVPPHQVKNHWKYQRLQQTHGDT